MHTHDDKLLRESIRQILREGADSSKIYELVESMKQINSIILSNHVSKGLDRNQAPIFGVLLQTSGDPMTISFAVMGIDEDGNLRPDHITPMDESDAAYLMEDHIGITVPWGAIRFGSQYSSCSGAMAVQVTHGTKSGWGPLLYELAIETATLEAGGLTSDRREVSPSARAVWNNYDKNRGDVEKVQQDLTDEDIEERGMGDPEVVHLTPDPRDDCDQSISFEDMMQNGALKKRTDWIKSPLSRVYRKPPVITGLLDNLGLLFQE